MNTRACERCGEHLRARHSHRARFCSSRCRVAAHRAARADALPPAELRRADRWVRRSATKRPLRADYGWSASSTNPRTWTSYDKAAASPHGVGLGFVLNGDGIVCIDLDHCISGGRLASWAQDIVDRCPPTYMEVSAGGEGLHIWGRGRVAGGRRFRRNGTCVEVYGDGRYIALGERYRDAPTTLADLTGVVGYLTSGGG